MEAPPPLPPLFESLHFNDPDSEPTIVTQNPQLNKRHFTSTTAIGRTNEIK